MSRRLAREKVLQCLFSIEVGKNNPEEALLVMDEEELAQQDRVFAENVVYGVLEHLVELDGIYVPFLKDWQLERIANVDRILLRIATYEMNYLKDIPHAVSINEAVELAKVFGGEETPKFINAVLDNVKNNITTGAEESNSEISRD